MGDTERRWSRRRPGLVRTGIAESGPVICACFGVGVAAIPEAIASRQPRTSKKSAALRAGTNCGTCLPELKRIVA